MSDLDTLNAVLSAPAPTATEPATQQPPAQPAAETPPGNEPTTTPAATPPATPGTEGQQTPPAQPAAPATPPAATPPAEETPEQIFNGNRQNQAFAQMRVQNKQLQETVGRLGQIMGLPSNLPPDQLVPIVQQRLLEIEAKANNIPVELAQRLEQAEQQRQENEAAMLKNNAALAFQKVKDTYSLTQEQLVAFAQQLNQAGKNPYQQPLDLLQEYRLLNFDKLLEDARKQAAQEALARQTKAATQSTTPPKASGTPGEPTSQISSVSELNRLLGGR